MQTISDCIQSTPTYWLSTIAPIATPEIRRQETLPKEYIRILWNPQLPIHEDVPDLAKTEISKSRNTWTLSKVYQALNYHAEYEKLWIG